MRQICFLRHNLQCRLGLSLTRFLSTSSITALHLHSYTLRATTLSGDRMPATHAFLALVSPPATISRSEFFFLFSAFSAAFTFSKSTFPSLPCSSGFSTWFYAPSVRSHHTSARGCLASLSPPAQPSFLPLHARPPRPSPQSPPPRPYVDTAHTQHLFQIIDVKKVVTYTTPPANGRRTSLSA